ncbi:MAG TPA: sulfurtransferase TusA family protein [Candidatus Limnocylindria bacterium]|nr:sulfurtransferase TusA family protein [Candidatus Limnocylindria bacterium]
MKVRLPGSLRDATGGVTRIEAAGGTLAAVVADLERRYPALEGKILDERGSLQSYLNVYIGDQDARHVGGGDAAVPDDADVMVIPAMSGGADAPTVVDARGAMCPMPIVKLQKAVKAVPVGALVELIATDPGSDPDVKAWGRETGNEIVRTDHTADEFRFLIRRAR